MTGSQNVILISCPDSRGLIHKVTGVLFRHSLNITENHEFVDWKNQMFFMRTAVSGSFSSQQLLEDIARELPPRSSLELRPQTPKKLVLLATKEPHCLGDLLLRHSAGELKADIAAVVSQYDVLKDLVGRFEIPFHCVPVGEKNRTEHEAALQQAIQSYAPDFLILAKYMRILSPGFVSGYGHRIINIHHSFLPAFIGKDPYLQAYERGVKIIGATAHFVNEQLDEGPIITQSVIPISHSQDAATIARSGRDVEKIVLAKALSLVLENRVVVYGQKTIIFE